MKSIQTGGYIVVSLARQEQDRVSIRDVLNSHVNHIWSTKGTARPSPAQGNIT